MINSRGVNEFKLLGFGHHCTLSRSSCYPFAKPGEADTLWIWILACLRTSSSWPTHHGQVARFTGFHLDILTTIPSYKYPQGRNNMQRSTLTSNPRCALMAAVFFPSAAANMRKFTGGMALHTRLIITWETPSLSKGLTVCAWDSEKTSMTLMEFWQNSSLC